MRAENVGLKSQSQKMNKRAFGTMQRKKQAVGQKRRRGRVSAGGGGGAENTQRLIWQGKNFKSNVVGVKRGIEATGSRQSESGRGFRGGSGLFLVKEGGKMKGAEPRPSAREGGGPRAGGKGEREGAGAKKKKKTELGKGVSERGPNQTPRGKRTNSFLDKTLTPKKKKKKKKNPGERVTKAVEMGRSRGEFKGGPRREREGRNVKTKADSTYSSLGKRKNL